MMHQPRDTLVEITDFRVAVPRPVSVEQVAVIGNDSHQLHFDALDDTAHLEAEWRALEARAGASLFQSWTWTDAWMRSAMIAAGERASIVVGRDPHGVVRVLMPLAIRRRLGARVLGWLGQSHANYNMGLVDPAYRTRLSPLELRRLVTDVGRAKGAVVADLVNQPTRWGGHDNPFALIAPQPTANDSFALDLEPEFKSQFERLFSARTRSTLRRKERKLAEAGTVRFVDAVSTAERLVLLDAFFEQKRAQLKQTGAANAFARTEIQDFYRALAKSADDPRGRHGALQLQALTIGEHVIAVAVTMGRGDREYLLNTSFSSSLGREASPGRLLIQRHIEKSAGAGRTTYDFGPGELGYKLEWEPHRVSLVHSIFPLSASGIPVAAALVAMSTAKRVVKRTPALWTAAQAIRKTLRTMR